MIVVAICFFNFLESRLFIKPKQSNGGVKNAITFTLNHEVSDNPAAYGILTSDGVN